MGDGPDEIIGKVHFMQNNYTQSRHIKKIEELSMNAWPSYKIELFDKWLIRFSHQYTYRTNCVEQIGRSSIPIPEKVSYCEQIYSEYNTPCSFKISPVIPSDFDDYLESLGYDIKHVTNVMTMSLDGYVPAKVPDIDVNITDTISDDWIMQLFKLNHTTNPVHLRIVPGMFRAIPKKTIVASILRDGKMVASGLGILDRDDLGIYAIYTSEDYRRCGYAYAICNAILDRGIAMGAGYSYLQVVKDNDSAVSLYEKLGFKHDYTYWFRSKVTGKDSNR